MCLAQGPQRSDAQTRGLSVWSQALHHCPLLKKKRKKKIVMKKYDHLLTEKQWQNIVPYFFFNLLNIS